MKILSIDRSNISHKAYFKPNEHFRDLYTKSAKTKELLTAAETFKNFLPKHELEITNVDESKISDFIIYTIKNNVTQKLHREFVRKNRIAEPRYGLCGMLNSCNRLFATDFYKEACFNNVTDLFKILTTK